MHGCFVSQNGWLVLSWYLPVGQPSQNNEFAVAENLPIPHGVQMRSAAAIPSVSMCVPAVHKAWSMQ